GSRAARGLIFRDVVDEGVPEAAPWVHSLLVERDGDAKCAPLPRSLEDELAVASGERGVALHVRDVGIGLGGHGQRARAGELTFTTPIMESRVTSFASSSSARPSVPAGRSGSTM